MDKLTVFLVSMQETVYLPVQCEEIETIKINVVVFLEILCLVALG